MIKQIEILFRTIITAFLTGYRKPVRISESGALFDREYAPRSILFLRQDRIGDVLISTPILKALRERFPIATIDILLSTNNVAVKHAVAPYTNNVIVYNKSFRGLLSCIRRIRATSYDAVIDLMDNPSATSTIVVRTSRAAIRLGINKSNANVYTHVVELLDRSRVHIARRIAELVKAFGIDPDGMDLTPSYPVSVGEQHDTAARMLVKSNTNNIRLGINASGSGQGRRYPVKQTRWVIAELVKRIDNVDIYVLADPKNAEWANEVARDLPAQVVPPSPSFHNAAVALSLMQIIWTPDTSIVHLASAWHIPACVMYVHTNPSLLPWYPIGSHYEALTTTTTDVANIPKEEVLAAILRLFAYCRIPRGET